MKEETAGGSQEPPEAGRGQTGLARRGLLALIWALVLCILALMARSIASLLGASGPKEKTRYSMPVPDRFPFKGAEFWLDRDDEGLFAFLDRCPHLGCKPNYYPERKEYVCPCHGSRFSAGGVYESGPARKSMQRVLVRRGDGNDLVIELREKAPESYRLSL